jgi:hypothetical protein
VKASRWPSSTLSTLIGVAALLVASAAVPLLGTLAVPAGAAVTTSANAAVATGNINSPSSKTQPEDTSSRLNDVSCTSSAFCMAVGTYQQCTTSCSLLGLIETWNGTDWSIVPSPDPSPSNTTLSSVSCTSPAFCVAVGSYNPPPATDTLIESWDGSEWSVVSSPNVGTSNNFTNVSCSDPTFCMAIGGDGMANPNLSEIWDGSTWSVVPSVDVDNGDGSPNSVSCTSSTFCLAVGGIGLGGASQFFDTLAAVWNGSSWSVIATPNPGDPSSDFASVSCLSPTSCVAAGQLVNGNEENTLVENWDGTNWTAAPSTNDEVGVFTEAVSCVSTPTRFCFMQSVNSETWDGSTWSISPGPPVDLRVGLSCSSPTFCAAVSTYSATAVYLWNGSSWTSVNAPIEDALSITTATLPGGTVGVGYSSALVANGGNPPYKWKLVKGGGRLPAGLKLNKSTGVISGTPGKRSTTSTFTVEVSDTKTTTRPPIQNIAQTVLSIAIS